MTEIFFPERAAFEVFASGGTCARYATGRLKRTKSYTRSTMDEIRLSDLSVANIEFSENLDFNSVAKMKNRRKQRVK